STVFDDVAFGPKCLGLDENEIKERVEKSLELVGMTPEQYERSPFELSGGQRRRAAIAGVLAMSPKYLVLDEPAAGLDPQGRRDILGLMRALHDEHGIGIILVSHSMEDVAEYADRVIVLHDGHIEMDGSPKEVFADSEHLFALGLDIPQVSALMKKLKERGLIVDEGIISEDEAVSEILKALYYTGR
ncbi:MAG: ATP-binding cassette domain-containing protein, partial [Lachnospiraceae bacterium]|nr:ATP-binding cassette domain-containing protein [Candidatus Minthocola equi]